SEIKMTSLDIAEVTGKQHQHILRDIRKEIEDLGNEVGQSIFGRTSYRDKSNREKPCFSFGKQGAMQLALKYDAKTRFKVIKRIEELENNNKPKSQAEIIALMAQNNVEQEKRLSVVEKKQDDITEILSLNPTEWRRKTTKII